MIPLQTEPAPARRADPGRVAASAALADALPPWPGNKLCRGRNSQPLPVPDGRTRLTPTAGIDPAARSSEVRPVRP
jgi:hypothetical protein